MGANINVLFSCKSSTSMLSSAAPIWGHCSRLFVSICTVETARFVPDATLATQQTPNLPRKAKPFLSCTSRGLYFQSQTYSSYQMKHMRFPQTCESCHCVSLNCCSWSVVQCSRKILEGIRTALYHIHKPPDAHGRLCLHCIALACIVGIDSIKKRLSCVNFFPQQ